MSNLKFANDDDMSITLDNLYNNNSNKNIGISNSNNMLLMMNRYDTNSEYNCSIIEPNEDDDNDI